MAMTPPPDWFNTDEAQQLLRHLEWQPEGFSLLFVFADALPAQWLADWLNAALRPAGLPLQQPTCAQQLADAPDAVVDALMAELGALAQAPGAVWLPLHHRPQHVDWDAARQRLLARLNERRFLLERDLPRPLLLVLPANFRPITREIAPDIWHIRVLSQQWRTPALSAAQNWCWEKLPAGFPISWDRQLWMGRTEDADALLREWRRSQQNENKAVMLATGWQACEALTTMGRLLDAKEIINPTLLYMQNHMQDNIFAENAKDDRLNFFLAFINWSAQAEDGFWKNIAIAVLETLVISIGDGFRMMDKAKNDAPLSLISMLILLSDAGKNLYLLGAADEASRAYRLAHELGDVNFHLPYSFLNPTVLSNIIYGRARISSLAGDHTKARLIYQNVLEYCERAITIAPSFASSLQRDLALIQLGLADAHMGLQDWPAAEQALANSVAIFRQLAAAPRAPRHAREDLAIALARQALLPPGDLAPLQEAEDLLLQLSAEFVEVPAYPRELNAVRELQSLVAVSSCYAD